MEFIFIVFDGGEMNSEDFTCLFNCLANCIAPVFISDPQRQFGDDVAPGLFLNFLVYTTIPKYPHFLLHNRYVEQNAVFSFCLIQLLRKKSCNCTLFNFFLNMLRVQEKTFYLIISGR